MTLDPPLALLSVDSCTYSKTALWLAFDTAAILQHRVFGSLAF
jgi:hypothetical protein